MRLTCVSRLAFIASLGTLSLACGSQGSTNESSGGTSGPVVTGVGGGAASVSHAAVTSGGDGGAGGHQGHGAPYPIVFAHGFFGFDDFAGLGFESYFYQVKDTLAQQGEVVFTPAVDPFNDSDTRGAELLAQVQDVLALTGAAKVNIVGHSQGGLDARVVANLRPDLVASVITIATPHEGTPVADVVLQLVSDPNYQQIIDDLANVIGAPLYDQLGNQSSVFKALKLFSQPGIKAFNAAHPDEPTVFYASLAGRSNLSFGGSDCTPDFEQSFVSSFEGTLDPINPLLSVTAFVLDGTSGITNDGMVRARDAHRGEFWGCVPADHLDEVGQILGASPGLGNDWKYMDFYTSLVSTIRTRGL